MNTIIIILVVLITPFVLAFILGAIKASILGSDKKRRARALVSLSQMTEEQITALKDIFLAYKANDINKTNRISKEASPEIIRFLVGFFDYNNRPVEYSSGKAGKIIWINFENKLKKLGYSDVVSKIIPGVVMDNYNEVLEKITNKQEKTLKIPVNNPGDASISGNYKSCLITQAFEVEKLLKKYVLIHNKRLKTAGTFRSLFRDINFEEIYKEIDELYRNFETKRVEIMTMKDNYTEYTKTQQDFYDILISYFSPLFEAVEILQVISNKQNELSKGLGKGKLTFGEYLNLEKKYKEKIQAYVCLGDKLNYAFDLMKKEVNL